MLLTDLNGPMPLQPRSPGLRRISRSIRFAAPAILFLYCATFCASVSRAQDQQDQSVAEAARRERTRKLELQKRAKHVYTEEDLKHPNILTPDDRAQIEAKRNECAQKNNCSAPTQNPPASLDANSPAPGNSLGEVARQLRKQKELQALKPKRTEPFHLPFTTPALASPILPERPAIRPPGQPDLHPRTPSNVFRRDPFAAVPIRPEVRRPEDRSGVRENVSPDVHADDHVVRENIRPTIREGVLSFVRPNVRPDFSKDVRPKLRPHGRITAPALPEISSRPATPNILIQPMQPPAPFHSLQPVAPIETARPIEPKRPLHTVIATQNTVSVQRGDSLWKLAQQNLGRGNRWPELMASNPWIADPNQIRAGAQLNLPVAAFPVVNRSAKSNAAATIKVRKGDTLWTLAKAKLGRSLAWPCLAQANPVILDANRIYENEELFIPVGCEP